MRHHRSLTFFLRFNRVISIDDLFCFLVMLTSSCVNGKALYLTGKRFSFFGKTEGEFRGCDVGTPELELEDGLVEGEGKELDDADGSEERVDASPFIVTLGSLTESMVGSGGLSD